MRIVSIFCHPACFFARPVVGHCKSCHGRDRSFSLVFATFLDQVVLPVCLVICYGVCMAFDARKIE